jgi:hypothetical protein
MKTFHTRASHTWCFIYSLFHFLRTGSTFSRSVSLSKPVASQSRVRLTPTNTSQKVFAIDNGIWVAKRRHIIISISLDFTCMSCLENLIAS